MSRFVLVLALAGALAPAANAQQPGPRAGGPGGPPGMDGGPSAASMLLSRTGDLKLSDAQVTRLAAIARRTADRRTANRGALDSIRAQFRPNAQGGAQPPAGPPAAARALMERIRTQQHDDLRDALAVLTPDQQATAWEGMARRGMMERAGARMRRMGGRGMMGPGRNMAPGGRRGPGMAPQPGGRVMRQPAPGDSASRRPRRPEQ